MNDREREFPFDDIFTVTLVSGVYFGLKAKNIIPNLVDDTKLVGQRDTIATNGPVTKRPKSADMIGVQSWEARLPGAVH